MSQGKDKLYDNCAIQAPDGVLLGRCNLKQARWYLDRNLATVVEQQPYLAIRLTFEPKGRSAAGFDVVKENKCVVCGATKDLSSHHVVPYCYVRRMPNYLVKHRHWNCLPLCVPCHSRYENASNWRRQELARSHGIDPHGEYNSEECRRLSRMSSLANTLLKHRPQLPADRCREMESELATLHGSTPTVDEMRQMIGWRLKNNSFRRVSEMIVAKETDLEAFARSWREHFVQVMKPQHLPPWWSVDCPFRNPTSP